MPASNSDAFLQRFGRAIQRRRLAVGHSVRTGAVFLGVSPSALQQIEAGERDVAISTAVHIAKKLCLSIDELGRLR